MRRKKMLRHGFWALALSALLVFSAQSSRADDFYPGLPDPDVTTGASWGSSAQGGISYAKRAKQWFRSPDAMVTFTTMATSYPQEGDVRRFSVYAKAFMVSPKGAPENYGYMAPMTVRSVGFGLMPVEATVQVSQRRKNGYPIPLEATLSGADHYDDNAAGGVSKQTSDRSVVEDAFNVEILKVKVDGVDLGLVGGCRTVKPAPVKLVGPEFAIPEPRGRPTAVPDWFRAQDPATYFSPIYGGSLTGAMTIPAFTGCVTTSGDDLSALMTLSVSGPDNPVSARAGWMCSGGRDGGTWPLGPGESTPKLTPWYCHGTKKFEYPQRPAT